EYSNQNNFV
nr:Chain A, Major prion protein [Homo sapiens]